MASKILLKKSTTASAVPTTLDLDTGEVAINTEDKRLFTKDSGGSIVEVSTTPSTMDVDGNTTVGGTLGVTGNTTLSGTLGVTGATTLGTATVSTKLTVPTPVDNTDAASKGYVDTEVSSAVATMIDSSPAALDTLNELAAALGDDPNFSTTITTTIGTKLPKDGSEAMSGNLDLGTNKVVNVVDPTSAQDAATKAYVDTADATKLNLSGGTMSGDIAMGTNSITGLADPTSAQDAATKAYIDSVTGSLTDAADSAADAEKLAINPEDSQYTLSDGTTTGFSALHYAAKADDSATAAGNAQTAAEAAQTAAETAYDNFDDRYLGAKATAPALDNDGDALVAGALYFDTTAGAMYVYDGSAWDQVALTPGDFLTVNNNLSDLSNTATAISNLGITATAAELNYVDGVTSNIQTQIDNIDVDPTKGTLTKTFANGETASITLSGAISPAPVVSVTKEVAQTGVSSKGGWDVATDGANYELHDTAYDTTLTPGSVTDLSAASYDSVSFGVTSQESSPQGFAFNNNGTKMYVVGAVNNTVYQYTLSTAFDASTASYDSVSFSVSSQAGSSHGVGFNNDGTKMYVVDNSTDTLYQYSLSTAFDISTSSYDSVSFSVSSQDTTPLGFTFNNDGTKMYVVGQANDNVYQYTLSTAYDLSSASYDSVSFSVASQETASTGVTFNSDGTKMYITGNTDSVFEYTLSTAFDLSTASYNSVSFSATSQDTSPTEVLFNTDGTKMYILGNSTDSVYQYSVGAEALLLGSGSFASTDVGKRIVGNGGEAVLTATDGSYSVVTAFDDSSTIASGSWSMFALTFDGTDGVTMSGLTEAYVFDSPSFVDNFAFNSQVGELNGFELSPDGTKMNLLNHADGYVYRYTLSTAFDISTATYANTRGYLLGQDTGVRGITFKADGTKMYMLGQTNDKVYEYNCSTAFDGSTISYVAQSPITVFTGSPRDLNFNPDGTRLFICDNNYLIRAYDLSTAWDITTMASSGSNIDLRPNIPSDMQCFGFYQNGTKMWVTRFATMNLYLFDLSTAYEPSTFTFNETISFSGLGGGITRVFDVQFNDTGTEIFIAAESTYISTFSIGNLYAPTSTYHPTVTKASGQIDTAFWTDINTMTADETLNGGEVYYAVSTDDRTTWAVIDDTDGVRPIVRNNAGTWQYNTAVGTAGFGFSDASTGYDSVSLSVSSNSSSIWGIEFNDDGTKLFVVDDNNNQVDEYALSTAYDISTGTYSATFSVGSQTGDPTALFFKPDGTKMFVGDRQNEFVREYTLSTAFDITTASHTGSDFGISSQETDIRGLTFNNDGTKMYVAGNTNDTVYQYALSTAWDISTASYESKSLSVSSEMAVAGALRFNTDGTKLFVQTLSTGTTPEDIVAEYTISTPYDVSTGSYSGSFIDVGSESNIGTGMTFNADGTKMYISDNSTNTIYQYTTIGPGYTTSTTWVSATTNDELYALQEALEEQQFNRMNSTQLNAVTDPNHYTLGNTLDLAIMLYTASAGSIPQSDGVSINYDAEALNQGAVVGTDYDFDFPDSTTVRITSNAAQNLKVRVV